MWSHSQQLPKVQAFRSSSSYRKQKVTPNKPPHTSSGYGSTTHRQKGANDRPTKCPAWGKICQNCQKLNHFACVCWQKEYNSANALITHVTYDDSSAYNTEEIPALVSTTIPPYKNNSLINFIFFQIVGPAYA